MSVTTPEVVEVIILTPMADWLEENWTDEQYLADSNGFDELHPNRGCVGGVLMTCENSPWLEQWNKQESPRPGLGLIGIALFHWNNRHGRAAAIAAVRQYERTGKVPVCPGHRRNSGGVLYYDPLRVFGRCEYAQGKDN